MLTAYSSYQLNSACNKQIMTRVRYMTHIILISCCLKEIYQNESSAAHIQWAQPIMNMSNTKIPPVDSFRYYCSLINIDKKFCCYNRLRGVPCLFIVHDSFGTGLVSSYEQIKAVYFEVTTFSVLCTVYQKFCRRMRSYITTSSLTSRWILKAYKNYGTSGPTPVCLNLKQRVSERTQTIESITTVTSL